MVIFCGRNFRAENGQVDLVKAHTRMYEILKQQKAKEKIL